MTADAIQVVLRGAMLESFILVEGWAMMGGESEVVVVLN